MKEIQAVWLECRFAKLNFTIYIKDTLFCLNFFDNSFKFVTFL